jgi:hypothetical protein
MGVAGRRFVLCGRTSVRRGEASKQQSAVGSQTLRRLGAGRGDVRAAGSRTPEGANVLWVEPRGVSRSRGVGNSPCDLANAGADGAACSERCGRACSSGPNGAGSQRAFGPAPAALVDRVGSNPMGACRVKQTDEVPGGENRQEGVKPWRRKGRRSGKPAAGVLQTAIHRQARTLIRGLPVLMAPKGQKTSGEVLSGERTAGRSRGAWCRKTPQAVGERTAKRPLVASR